VPPLAQRYQQIDLVQVPPLVKLVLLTLLDWELRLQKTAVFKSFAAATKMHQKRMGRERP
jgi:hypothetical protein